MFSFTYPAMLYMRRRPQTHLATSFVLQFNEPNNAYYNYSTVQQSAVHETACDLRQFKFKLKPRPDDTRPTAVNRLIFTFSK